MFPPRTPPISRRQFVCVAAAAAVVRTSVAETTPLPPLAGQLGITTGSFVRHLSESPQAGKLRLLDLPRIMRDELDMRVIDLMTATLPSLEPAYLEQFRSAAEKSGCWLTNLKMNQRDLDLGSEDEAVRRLAMDEYKRTIDAAARLGVRWVRPLPGNRRPNLATLAGSYRELIEYAAPFGITLLVENFSWLGSDPEAIPELIKIVGKGLAAQPDTGNWASNDVRYAGLARAFPLAASCDFKALEIATDGNHAAYDLKRCFDIGWDAGFRGPWCFEHAHADLAAQFRDFGQLRDWLRGWMAARQSK
jgi:Xylose isomerase-like TIM barrel